MGAFDFASAILAIVTHVSIFLFIKRKGNKIHQNVIRNRIYRVGGWSIFFHDIHSSMLLYLMRSFQNYQASSLCSY